MWLCAALGWRSCWSTPRCPRSPGRRAAALVEQAADAVGRVAAAGWLPASRRAAEYGSPHGGSWLELLAARLTVVGDAAEAEVVLDCFRLMHSPDQAAALAERAARVAPGGVLLLQYHSLGTIVRLGQWNSLRHGHYAYYSTAALAACGGVGFTPARPGASTCTAGRSCSPPPGPRTRRRRRRPGHQRDRARGRGNGPGVEDPRGSAPCRSARHPAPRRSTRLADQRAAGARSSATGPRRGRWRCCAGRASTARCCPAVADAPPAKHGRRMPATDIPVVAPSELVAARLDAVALFLPDLLPEMRATLPQVEAAGGAGSTWRPSERRPPLTATHRSGPGVRGLHPW